MRSIAVLTAAVLLSGCYEYLAPPTGSSLTGRRVNVTLTDMGSAALASQIGPSNDAIGGTLLADSGNVYVVSVVSVRARSGLESGWRGEQVAVPIQYVDRLEERTLSKRRTVLATILAGAALYSATKAFGGFGGSNAPGSTGGGTTPR